MPLRDHFRPPLDARRHWEGLHGQWPAMLVQDLSKRLPPRYVAEPRVHLGSAVEVDVATFRDAEATTFVPRADAAGGGVATALWAPPEPTLAVRTDVPEQDEYEVRVFDTRSDLRLVAAVEIVSPANKDRPHHRRTFVAKCAALLRQGVSVALVDLVTTRQANLYADLLELLGQSDPSLGPEPPPVYAAACRWRLDFASDGLARRPDNGATWTLEAWAHRLSLGHPLPTLPLWLADDLAVPLELENTYEETCRVLRIP